MRHLRLGPYILFVVGLLSRSAASAEPKGQLFITKDRLGSGGQLNRASMARVREIHMVWPTEETGNDHTVWVINYAALFQQPLGDFQAELKFWDVTKGPAHFITAEEQFTRDKETHAMTGQLRVSGPQFERNHRYLARLEGRRGVLGQVTFWLRGTPPHYDGRADFSDDTAK
jgi:hypothetical protein